MYLLSDYDYELPPELIAQSPEQERENSRLLVCDRGTGSVHHHRFHEITDLLTSSDVLVINDTRVIPARLIGQKKTGGRVEALLIDFAGGTSCREADHWRFECQCLIRSSKSPKPGTELQFGSDLHAYVKDGSSGTYTVEFISEEPFARVLEKYGKVPLPPYIERNPETGSATEGTTKDTLDDRCSYQTVYANHDGAVAAPTAGLHFTDRLLSALQQKGIDIVTLTLHVSYGTFMPVRVDDIREHCMHSERYQIGDEAALKINTARKNGRRIIAVGTTSVRTLEYNTDENGILHAGNGSCDLFIYPGYRFKAVDAMITNFHLPKSTLMMLVSAFAGRDNIMAAYQAAISERYRFFSYGDAMFIR